MRNQLKWRYHQYSFNYHKSSLFINYTNYLQAKNNKRNELTCEYKSSHSSQLLLLNQIRRQEDAEAHIPTAQRCILLREGFAFAKTTGFYKFFAINLKNKQI